MLELYFVYNGHCKFYLGTFDNVDDLIMDKGVQTILKP
ncbi:phage protein [Streptococcus pneumoniae]|nr:phage protein [Streptococcus pneumoniae]